MVIVYRVPRAAQQWVQIAGEVSPAGPPRSGAPAPVAVLERGLLKSGRVVRDEIRVGSGASRRSPYVIERVRLFVRALVGSRLTKATLGGVGRLSGDAVLQVGWLCVGAWDRVAPKSLGRRVVIVYRVPHAARQKVQMAGEVSPAVPPRSGAPAPVASAGGSLG